MRSASSTPSAGPSSAAAQPLLIGKRPLSQLLGVSERTLGRMDAAGRIPRAVVCNRTKKWRLAEIRAWVDAGCPDRKTWEKIRTF
jgi:predicted DNA-binding transcriptional regulator AlpA